MVRARQVQWEALFGEDVAEADAEFVAFAGES